MSQQTRSFLPAETYDASGVIVTVTPPDVQLIESITEVSLDWLNLWFFRVSVRKQNDEVTTEICLSDWLLELSGYLRDGRTDRLKIQLYSGDSFDIEKLDTGYRLRLFDYRIQSSVALDFTLAELRDMHAALTTSLLGTIHRAAGKPILVRDIDRLELDDRGAAP